MGERLPDFLVIGAYKSGTTSLFRDLAGHPEIGVPEAKEVRSLVHDAVLSPEGRARYAAYFRAVADRPVVGEVAPQYTAEPYWRGVAERAAKLMGSELRVIYVVRHPIVRIASHLAHRDRAAPGPAEIDGALPSGRFFEADVSCYGYQVAPWLRHFPRRQIHIVPFERYAEAPQTVCAEVFAFLGVDPGFATGAGAHANATAERPQKPRHVRRLLSARLYRLYVQPYVPRGLRSAVSRTLFPPARETASQPTLPPPSAQALYAALAPDIAAFHRELELAQPLWPDLPPAVRPTGV